MKNVFVIALALFASEESAVVKTWEISQTSTEEEILDMFASARATDHFLEVMEVPEDAVIAANIREKMDAAAFSVHLTRVGDETWYKWNIIQVNPVFHIYGWTEEIQPAMEKLTKEIRHMENWYDVYQSSKENSEEE